MRRPPIRPRSLMRGLVSVSAASALALALGACAPRGAATERIEPSTDPRYAGFPLDPGIRVVEDLVYGAADGGAQLRLDACLPPGSDAVTSARPALILVHGGSWARGSKNDIPWRSTCQWLARGGYPTFTVNYRLAPLHPYPAAIEDLRTAVEWLRDDEQVETFALDPARIGAVGGSAGGNLAALLGAEGEGPLDEGSRIAAVVDLSGPADLTGRNVTPEFEPAQLSYLGCRSRDACPQAVDASVATWIDESDPPFFVAHSSREYIPLAQSQNLVSALRDAGVDTEFVTVDGTLHSIAMLSDNDELRARILDFLDRELADQVEGVVP